MLIYEKNMVFNKNICPPPRMLDNVNEITNNYYILNVNCFLSFSVLISVRFFKK